MNRPLYERVALHRLIQSINWRGAVYTFKRSGRNEYGEETDIFQPIAQLKGIFHDGSSGHLSIILQNGGMISDKNAAGRNAPSILTHWGNAEKLKLDDIVELNNEVFRVSGINNLGQMNIACEISLEVV